jgi:hypothetical protein
MSPGVAVPLRPEAAALADHDGFIVDVLGVCSLATASTRSSSSTARSPVCIWTTRSATCSFEKMLEA